MGEGLASYMRRMQAIPAAARAALGPCLVEAAEDLAETVRALAPVDEGHLRESVTVTGPNQATPPYSQPGGEQVVPENAAAVTVGNTDVRYPHLVEYGTEDAPAQPYFWPAYRMRRKALAAKIKRRIGKAVRDAK